MHDLKSLVEGLRSPDKALYSVCRDMMYGLGVIADSGDERTREKALAVKRMIEVAAVPDWSEGIKASRHETAFQKIRAVLAAKGIG